MTVSSQEDNDLPAESDLRARLIALMGGRAAEELLFHEVTPGAANDFEKATQIATNMVNRWGMGRDPRESDSAGRGSLSFFAAKQGATLPSELQAAATRAVAAILDQAYTRRARHAHQEHGQAAPDRRLPRAQERIDGDTFDALFDGSSRCLTRTSSGAPPPPDRASGPRSARWRRAPRRVTRARQSSLSRRTARSASCCAA